MMTLLFPARLEGLSPLSLSFSNEYGTDGRTARTGLAHLPAGRREEGGKAMTAQVPDSIRYQGQEYPLLANPLEQYWKDAGQRPRFIPPSTANWRGYVATWTLEDNILYLTALSGRVEQGEVTLDTLFPDNNGRVEASWFNGALRLPQGEMVHYRHMGYESLYARELILSIEAGHVSGTREVRNAPDPD